MSVRFVLWKKKMYIDIETVKRKKKSTSHLNCSPNLYGLVYGNHSLSVSCSSVKIIILSKGQISICSQKKGAANEKYLALSRTFRIWFRWLFEKFEFWIDNWKEIHIERSIIIITILELFFFFDKVLCVHNIWNKCKTKKRGDMKSDRHTHARAQREIKV